MEVKLVITSTKDQDPNNELGKEYVFQDVMTIYIGRGKSNDVPLTDPDRKVSRNHARLVVSNQGYVLEDLGSKNSSFVNNDRIGPGEQKALRNGDRITVGEFTFEYHLTYSLQYGEEPFLDPVALEPTVLQINPFTDAVEDVFKALRRVCDLYDHQDESSRKEHLSHAIENSLPTYEKHETMNILLNSIAKTELATNPQSTTQKLPRRKPISRARKAKLNEQESLILDSVLFSLHELLLLPHKFSGDFLGSMTENGEDSPFLQENYTLTKKYLIDSSSSPAELDKRLEQMKIATKHVIDHHEGLIEGYHAVVRDVLKMVIHEVDPNPLEKNLGESKALFRMFPALRSHSVLQTLKKNLEQIQMSDWKMYEQRVYRPVFIQAYLSSTGRKVKTEEKEDPS